MDFEKIEVSTQTFTVRSNIKNIDLMKFFNHLQLTEQILCIKYKMLQKGECFSKKHKKLVSTEKNTWKNFLNCITLVVQVEKKVNIKIFKNGVFQLTGCKHVTDVKCSLDLIIRRLSKLSECFSLSLENTEASPFVIYIKSAMRNIDFDLGFKINRTVLSNYLHHHTIYVVPPLISNMGVKLKIPIDNLETLPITKITYDRKTLEPQEEILTYAQYVAESDLEQKKNKDKFVSITVFQNGKVLMSAIDKTYQKVYYQWFVDMINTIGTELTNVDLPKKTFKIF